MRAYQEDYPVDASLDLVFRDLHAKAGTQLETFGELNADQQEGVSQEVIAGTPFRLFSNKVEGRGGRSVFTAFLQLSVDRGAHTFTEVSYVQEDDGWELARVGGHRDYETWGTCTMERQNGKLIVVKLGGSAVKDAADDLAGVTTGRGSARLDELPETDLCRVETAIEGILGDLATVELIRGGAAPEEAFRRMNRVPATA